MAMKLFNKKPEVIEEDTFTKLDRLMSEMASTETLVAYLREREGMQLEVLVLIILLLVLFGMATSDGIGKGDVDDNGL